MQTDQVLPGQRWQDEERGEVRVLAVAEGYAMLRRRRRNPFVVSVDQMLAGQYGWRQIKPVSPLAERQWTEEERAKIAAAGHGPVEFNKIKLTKRWETNGHG